MNLDFAAVAQVPTFFIVISSFGQSCPSDFLTTMSLTSMNYHGLNSLSWRHLLWICLFGRRGWWNIPWYFLVLSLSAIHTRYQSQHESTCFYMSLYKTFVAYYFTYKYKIIIAPYNSLHDSASLVTKSAEFKTNYGQNENRRWLEDLFTQSTKYSKNHWKRNVQLTKKHIVAWWLGSMS